MNQETINSFLEEKIKKIELEGKLQALRNKALNEKINAIGICGALLLGLLFYIICF